MPPEDLREISEQSRPERPLRGAYSYLRLVTNHCRPVPIQRIGSCRVRPFVRLSVSSPQLAPPASCSSKACSSAPATSAAARMVAVSRQAAAPANEEHERRCGPPPPRLLSPSSRHRAPVSPATSSDIAYPFSRHFLRHRLPLKAHDAEGHLPVQEDANVADLAVDQVVHVGERRCHANAAGSERGPSAQERDHALAIDLVHAVKLDPKIGFGFLDVRKELTRPLPSEPKRASREPRHGR
jgi:hypothetical protein